MQRTIAHARLTLLALALAAPTLAAAPPAVAANVLQLHKGDRVCLVGNALGERMQHHNHFETLLYARFPDMNLVVRNLCFPGDEPDLRIRSENFGSPDEHLTHSQADVILYFFGFNESFAGPAGVDGFTADLEKLIAHNKEQKYNGKSAPRIVLVSPIATDLAGLPSDDGREQDANLKHYTDAMAAVAKKSGVGFVDLFTPTQRLFLNATLSATNRPYYTMNGVHLTDAGYQLLAPILFRGLFPDEPMVKLDADALDRVHAQVTDKNFHWRQRYRAVNGYSIYGPRGKAGKGPDGHNNTAVMEREREILDVMTANRDQRIWAVAQGKPLSTLPKAVLDDSNTPDFIQVVSNVGPQGAGKQAGKVGTLEYRPPEVSQKAFKLPPGYEINLVASEVQFPDLANPVAINFDAKGRLWVSTMPSYPHWKPKTKMDDKVIILEDTNGDGRADKETIFARGLHQPTGFEIAPGSGGAYIIEGPDLIYAKDTDGDDHADVYQRVLFGFDTADSHHGMAAFEWGPGGALYFQEGTFKYSQLETPYGPVRMEEAGVWRFEPRSWRLEPYVSFRFANPWGHVFDRFGQDFVADASPGQNFWAAGISGRVVYPDKHPGGAQGGRFKEKTNYPQFLVKRVRPTSGCEIVSSSNFPPEAQGNYLLNNVIGFLGVLQHTVKEDGSGFSATEIEPLVQSTDGNFRPVDLQFGPDGALYICDWQNALIGHLQHNLRDPNRDHSHGRIWRVTYKDRPLVKPPQIAGAPIGKLLDLLKSYEDRTRYRVRRELWQREPDRVLAATTAWLAGLDTKDKDYEQHRLEGLWLQQAMNHVDPGLLKQVLRSGDPHARAAATRVLSYSLDRVPQPEALALLKAQVNDAHPRVRLEAVRAASFFDTAKAAEVALEATQYDMDEYLNYTLGETLNTLKHFQ